MVIGAALSSDEGNVNLSDFAYADDVVLVSKDSSKMQFSLSTFGMIVLMFDSLQLPSMHLPLRTCMVHATKTLSNLECSKFGSFFGNPGK